MASSYPPIPYPFSVVTSVPTAAMRLLIPMPIPRTPGVPYFDRDGVRTFLSLILQHGSNAGITYPDVLVDYIVRTVIQYVPEIDVDEPNRTWAAAHEQMLLLYGSSDEERRKLEVEQYLQGFQYIAGLLMKAREITKTKRDYYFVSGIPSAIKESFIGRVPEQQRTRSNPIPLTDSLQILYGYFDPDALFPELWDHLHNSAEPAVPISAPHESRPLRSTVPPMSTLSASESTPARTNPRHTNISIVPKPAPAPSPIQQILRSTVPIAPMPVSAPPITDFVFDYPFYASIEEFAPENDRTDCFQEDTSAQDAPKVFPSAELPENVIYTVECNPDEPSIIDQRYEAPEHPMYFCGFPPRYTTRTHTRIRIVIRVRIHPMHIAFWKCGVMDVWICGSAVWVPSLTSWAEVGKWGQRTAAPRGIDRSDAAAVAGGKGGSEIVHILDAVAGDSEDERCQI
ncbi:hypothetical protein B0H17DRAFT_1219895 [Mycena rosella]|uniref:Uncharacterized protein n=1 Tax=Mycena rosella TaxID=1033263 RepID=A0AAD7BEK9_MYCRO|nr:hypothetical protein B0H17DRAFT_1219895 [Mycena rosella]